MAVFEELSENYGDDEKAYHEISMRVGRIKHIPEKLIISATNPDAPSHWVYKHFMAKQRENRTVFYSVTEDNPFLPSSYIAKLKEDLDPMMAKRMLYGQWVEIKSEVIYHQYNKDYSFKPYSYEINPLADIHITWDFNIGEGKPLSLCLFQFIDRKVHVFGEVVIDGADTEESCHELAGKGWLDYQDMKYRIHGDATGKSRNTKSKASDYDIINKFMANYRTKQGVKLDYEIEVPSSNPPVRTRHNLMNAYCRNANNEVRLYVYKDAPTVDEGMRLTALKKGGQYVEDDTKRYQHITTALGYGVWWVDREIKEKPSVIRSQIR